MGSSHNYGQYSAGYHHHLCWGNFSQYWVITWISFYLRTSDLPLIDIFWSQEDQEVQYFRKAPIYPDCFPGAWMSSICPKMQRAIKKRPGFEWNCWGQTPGNRAMAALGRFFFLPPATTYSLPMGFCGDELDYWSTKHSATLKWVKKIFVVDAIVILTYTWIDQNVLFWD